MKLVKDYGVFSVYMPTPDTLPPGYGVIVPLSDKLAVPGGIEFCKNGAGDDFYALVYRNGQPATNNIFMALTTDGVVVSNVVDIDTYPPGRTLLGSPRGLRVIELSGVLDKNYHGFIWRGNATFVDSSTPPAVMTYKIDFWRRCTPDEAAQFTADLVEADPQLRQIFDAAVELQHDAPEFGLLTAAVLARVTPERAAELLAPSL